MQQKFSTSRFIKKRLGIWFLPVPFICIYIYLTRHDYIDGGGMAMALFTMGWTMVYICYLIGESIYRKYSKKQKPWLGIGITGLILGIWFLFIGCINLIWYLQ